MPLPGVCLATPALLLPEYAAPFEGPGDCTLLIPDKDPPWALAGPLAGCRDTAIEPTGPRAFMGVRSESGDWPSPLGREEDTPVGERGRRDVRLTELCKLASMLRLFLTASRERRLVRGVRLGMLCLSSSSLLAPWPCRDLRDMRGRGAARRLYSASVLGDRQRGELWGEGE